mmetsp:Transcript_237/g.561  ORF Transcript_237/g.561 Transcript_237/m.561 type:complete len:205 (+) Transcript_237:2855-3469(+)
MYCFSGSKSTIPSCLLSILMAVSKDPLEACSAIRLHFWAHFWAAGTPLVGTLNKCEYSFTSSSCISEAPPATSSGKSRSSISQPPSPSPRSNSSSSSTTSKSPSAPGMSRSKSSPPQAPPFSSSPPSISIIPLSAPLAKLSMSTPSNIVLATCSSGQFSAFTIGVGGSMRVPFAFTAGIGISCSVRMAAISSASSSKPWVFAVT